MTTKSITIKRAGCKFGGCVRKAVEPTSGDLPFAVELTAEGRAIGPDRAAEVSKGRISRATVKARTVLRKQGKGSGE
jgi:hypothetical protein